MKTLDTIAVLGIETIVIDTITRTHTAFATFEELLNAKGGYFPSIDVSVYSKAILADAYDKAQAFRGDRRRAFQYGQRASSCAASVMGYDR